MINNSVILFPLNRRFFKRILTVNYYSTYISKDSNILNKFGYYTKPSSLISHSPFNFCKYKSYSIAHHLNDKRVDFTHLPLPSGYVNSLKSVGIKDLKLFQYVILKLLTDNILVNSDSTTYTNFLRLVLYNEPGLGQSMGALIPLLYIYSHKYRGSSSSHPKGSLLVLCSGNSCHKVSNLLLGIDASVKCLVLDESSAHLRDSSKIGHDFVPASKDFFSKWRTNLVLLSGVSCLLFDDFSDLEDYNVFNRNLKVIRDSKNINMSDLECSKDFHIVCLVSSLGDKFPEFSRTNLSNYALYDFKFGTKQRLISDDRTDVLKVDSDFGQAKVINLESEESLENRNIEHSICKVSKGEKYDRVAVLRNLVYAYLDLPTFMHTQALPPCLKKPTSKSKCIIFVSNRKQLTKLANTQEFSNLCVYLGRHLNVYERAKSISSFNNGSKPIMIATDNSVYGSIFEDVSHVFNFNPPKTAESYKSRAAFARKQESLCVTLYSKDQYHNLVSVIRQVVKKISVHIVPSQEYMVKHDLKWLKNFTDQMIRGNRNLVSPYLKKSEDLLSRFGESVILSCANLLLRDKAFAEDAVDSGILTNSILSGRAGFTAVVLNDVSKQCINDESDIKKLFSKYVPDSKVSSALGKCYKTEAGYIVDVSDKYIRNFIELSRDNQDVYVQVATEVPKIVLNNPHIGKVHKKGLPWNSIDADASTCSQHFVNVELVLLCSQQCSFLVLELVIIS
ncbi:uncharacterized protein TOT_010001103 [Theileria orientalis strain Shintoku]|uniref:Helicase C-terminal domain-containing protein n=1 Tax=Theileria orientalis strain Shintoku TaxID=869250 RepID=J4DNW1_THEOR|nr:uncharacterized protein TOT_010001103 [Theileria orientalis strain Shintoku]BAM39649.1 uncharacterized protein TOT_010001103 [Theileria orientalis strain Shintoku]|eukprot:XP_009689950.1 uncharacterized protein TOT_010001103 [Theileria orientalis strain Shintoku]